MWDLQHTSLTSRFLNSSVKFMCNGDPIVARYNGWSDRPNNLAMIDSDIISKVDFKLNSTLQNRLVRKDLHLLINY